MKPFKKNEMTTLVACTANLTGQGYTENFLACEEGLQAPSNSKIYRPEEVKINSFYRFEGESDPADNSILYALETHDGVKGLLIDSYGANTNTHISQFIVEVEDIQKSVHVDDE
ncbi:MAG: hypothetical protein ACXVPN_09315 [Bacteroidia bacterium]